MSPVRIGVLALQGAFREHVQALRRLGAEATEVRTPAELAEVDALVIPGGESTTIDKLLDWSGLRESLVARLAAGMPAFGTCAGMIVLGGPPEDGTSDQRTLGRIDITTRRNGYGRQVASFEADVRLAGDEAPMHGVFIRAPRITRLGPGVEVVASYGDEPVAVAAGPILVASFHPELAGDEGYEKF